jgi:type II secretory ATPase GspE/PulE/Tfp pilus assembly ATPase PilB-like protein
MEDNTVKSDQTTETVQASQPAQTVQVTSAMPLKQIEIPAAQTAEEQATAAQVAQAKQLDEFLKQLQESILSANIPQMVMVSISYALNMRSSDIHIEPLENHVRIRYRVDGVLRHIVEYPTNLHPAVVSRIKIMSNLKIDEQRIPQDGRADVTTKDGRDMDLRISTLPTVNGEKVVMRIQDKSRKIPDLPELGISGISLKRLEDALKLPNGIVINTGPTGSGKTTTLYSCLQRVNKTAVNILTIEDPVEIQIDGLNQSQVHADIDYNFATGMRAALRQDPDIMMVGEIRDKETADTAIEASLTGHLVFSTLHTNSAVESLTRLINMGVAPYLLTSSLELIIAQRLVRKICDYCKTPAETSPDMIEVIKKAMENLHAEGEVDPKLVEGMQFYTSKGCEHCNNIGYYGRVGLYEVFRMDNTIRKLLYENASTIAILDASQKAGMVTLEQAGIIKALQGATTLDEVYRVSRKAE